MGTVGYMSPEQASGEPVDFRSDQFSLGSILYEMATGKRAFQRTTRRRDARGDHPRGAGADRAASNPEAPAPLRWIVERCLAKDPEERYASTRDLARDLAACATISRKAPSPASPRRPCRRNARRRRLLLGRRGPRRSRPRSPRPRPGGRVGRAARVSSPHVPAGIDGRRALRPGRPDRDLRGRLGGQAHRSSTRRAPTAPSRRRCSCRAPTSRRSRRPARWRSLSTRESGNPWSPRSRSAGGAPRDLFEGDVQVDYSPAGDRDGRLRATASSSIPPVRSSTIPGRTKQPVISPRFSPDGRWIAFIEDNGRARRSIAVVDLAGKKRNALRGLGDHRRPSPGIRRPERSGSRRVSSRASASSIFTRSLSGRHRVVARAPLLLLIQDIAPRRPRPSAGRRLDGDDDGRWRPGAAKESDLTWLDDTLCRRSVRATDRKVLLHPRRHRRGARTKPSISARPTVPRPCAWERANWRKRFRPTGSG